MNPHPPPPLVTIAMPFYNAGADLRTAVFSIIHQTLTNWELYIVDDGSTDNSLAYIEDIQDDRIKIIKDGLNKGLAARLNEVIQLAQGCYLARMDHDDISYPQRLAKQVNALENDFELDLIATRAIKITRQDKPIGYLPSAFTHEEITSKPWRGFYMPHPTWMGKVEWFRKHRYAVPAPYLCEDQELLLRTYQVSKFACIEDVCLAYRVKDKVSLLKLIKIRSKVFQLQLVKFVDRKYFKAIFYSILYFGLKLGKDILNSGLRAQYVPHNKAKVNNTDITKLNSVLVLLE